MQADLNRQWGEIVTLTKDLVLSVIRETLLTGVAIPRCLQEMSLLYKLWIGCSGSEKEGNFSSPLLLSLCGNHELKLSSSLSYQVMTIPVVICCR